MEQKKKQNNKDHGIIKNCAKDEKFYKEEKISPSILFIGQHQKSSITTATNIQKTNEDSIKISPSLKLENLDDVLVVPTKKSKKSNDSVKSIEKFEELPSKSLVKSATPIKSLCVDLIRPKSSNEKIETTKKCKQLFTFFLNFIINCRTG